MRGISSMTDDSLIGKQLGEYRLEALLGQGGMAHVYRAVDVRLKRNAVVKVIDPPSRNDAGYVRRFEREAQIIARLDHPHVVRLYRFDEQDGWLYMAMQYIEGADLGVVLANYRSDGVFIEPNDARRIIREICSALDYAHRQGIIHRDVKPANILLDRQGRAFLTDFGLALLTEAGTRGEIFGSAHYIAPEQAVSSAKAVPQSDIYAIGVILYEMFTGDVPFNAETPLDTALLHINELPVPPRQLRPDINPELEAVILKALAKKPEERYPTGAALAKALDRALNARSAVHLLAPPSTLSHLTIPERVALELDQQPLPPIPAGVAALAPPTDDLPPPKPKSSPQKRPQLISSVAVAGLGMILLTALLCFVLVAMPFVRNRFGQRDFLLSGQTPSTEAAQSIIRPTATLSASSIPLVNSSATPLATSPSASPASATKTSPSGYELNIVKGQGNESVIVINQAGNVFPLGLLRLGDDQGGISGAEWGVTNLESGSCVGVWKDTEGRSKYRLPEGLNCQLVGNLLLRDKRTWFGEKPFVVFYDGEQIGMCETNRRQCTIEILP
jgi:serine/threonine protein kinase